MELSRRLFTNTHSNRIQQTPSRLILEFFVELVKSALLLAFYDHP
jgi:hypothetical protein